MSKHRRKNQQSHAIHAPRTVTGILNDLYFELNFNTAQRKPSIGDIMVLIRQQNPRDLEKYLKLGRALIENSTDYSELESAQKKGLTMALHSTEGAVE